MPISIRRLEPGDRERWNELWQGYLTFYESTVPNEITDITWKRLLSPDEEPYGFAAVDEGGRIVGITHYLFHRSTWTEGSYCYLEDLFVDPEVRNSGAGRALILAVEEEARKEDCKRMYLNTQDFNTTARALYDKMMTKSPFIQYRTALK
ncbi:MAG: GNAT family N-acetyltransferase [Hyphomicrobiaceae bacterium]